jgi:opacity protein-like surface antigen
MKNLIAALSLVLVASTASAANLPDKKKTPVPPTRPVVEAPTNWYVGVNAGGALKSDVNLQNTPATVGGVVGYNFNKMFAVETTLEESFKNNGIPSQTRVMLNGVVSPFGSFYGFKPYVLAGAGTQNHEITTDKSGYKAIYNLGGGLKYDLSKSWEADARYRHVSAFSDTTRNRDSNVFTIGLNYKF